MHSIIIIDGILAQLVEHLTFNQVVRGSNPRCLMSIRGLKKEIFQAFLRARKIWKISLCTENLSDSFYRYCVTIEIVSLQQLLCESRER